MKSKRLSWVVLFLGLLGIGLIACGGGSGGGGGTGNAAIGPEIKAPISNPPVVLAGEPTTATVSAFVPGSYVNLFRLDGTTLTKIGEMADDGKNGDPIAGDHVYTIQVTVTESQSDSVIFRISATSNGQQTTKDISIPVVHIPSLTSDTELNQAANELFSKGLETQTLIKALASNVDNVAAGTMGQIGDSLVIMFSKFEAVTKQDFGFEIFNLAKGAQSINQLLDIFSDTPFDPRVNTLKQGLMDAGYLSEADLTTLSPLELRLNARNYLFNSAVNPNGEGVQFLKSAEKISIKQLLSYPVSLVGKGLSELFNLTSLGSIAVKEILGKGTGILVDWYTDDSGQPNVLIGQVKDNEEFTVPSGTHNILYSFGDVAPKAVVKDIVVSSQQKTAVDFSPGTITTKDTSSPSTPTDLVARTISSTRINLSWSASTDNVGTMGYKISKNGTYLKSVTSTSMPDSGLSPLTQYCYRVSAYDAAGNESNQSSQACATTQASTQEGVTVLASNLLLPSLLCLDGTHVYWTDGGTKVYATDRSVVKKVSLSGGTPLTLADFPYPGDGTGITVDSASIYWAATPGSGTGNLYKMPIEGGSVTTLAWANQPYDIAVDASYVYWAESNGGPSGSNAIKKVPINGGTVIPLTTDGTGHGVMATDENYIYSRYMDANSLQAIWKISKVNKNGGAVIDLAASAEDTPTAIAVDSSYVYWSAEVGSVPGSTTGTIKRVPINGGTVETLASGLRDPQRLVIDGNYIYFTEYATLQPSAGAIKKVSKNGGAASTVIDGLTGPVGIAIDNAHIYWTEFGPLDIAASRYSNGAVKRIGKQ